MKCQNTTRAKWSSSERRSRMPQHNYVFWQNWQVIKWVNEWEGCEWRRSSYITSRFSHTTEYTECCSVFMGLECNNSTTSRTKRFIFVAHGAGMKIDLVTRWQWIGQFQSPPNGKLRNKFEIISFMAEKVCCDAIKLVRFKSKTRRNIVCARMTLLSE